MGNLCVSPPGEGSGTQETFPEPKGQGENKNEAANTEDETEPEDLNGGMPVPPNPKGVLFTFKVPEPEKLVFHENKKDEVLDPKTDPKTVSKAWYGDRKEEWSEEKGVDVLAKVRNFLKEGKEISANSDLFGEPVPNRKVLLIERTFSIKYMDIVAKPLGMTFREEKPIVITKLSGDGNAKKLGVQLGWELLKVGDNDLSGKSYKESFALIKASIDKL